MEIDVRASAALIISGRLTLRNAATFRDLRLRNVTDPIAKIAASPLAQTKKSGST